MTHQAFVLASYGAAAFGLGATFVWLLLDGYRQRAALRKLQKTQSGTKPDSGRQAET